MVLGIPEPKVGLATPHTQAGFIRVNERASLKKLSPFAESPHGIIRLPGNGVG